MEPPHKKGAVAGRAGEEAVRRINVVYFLSRGGRTDHPHLFRVNHRSRAGGVRLRDVKRWLSEIRGKDMPENFSWSYKRKYKAGYVWQDLKDDDLITPVSDIEYVLKGSDVRGTPPRCVQAPKTSSLDEKEKRGDKDESAVEVLLTPDDSDESSPKPPSAAQDSPGGSGESTAALFDTEVSRSSQELHHQGDRSQRGQQHQPAVKAVARAVARPSSTDQEQLQRAVGGTVRAMRVARALHSILTCGAADADDAALRPVTQRSAAKAGAEDWQTPTPTCPGMDGCGLRVRRKARLRRGGNGQPGKRDGGGKRDGADAHKPALLPRCSQCGKEFKPQELHSHMQSCRGFKERTKSSASPRVSDSVDRSRGSAERRSKPGHHRSQKQPSPASAVFLLTESSRLGPRDRDELVGIV